MGDKAASHIGSLGAAQRGRTAAPQGERHKACDVASYSCPGPGRSSRSARDPHAQTFSPPAPSELQPSRAGCQVPEWQSSLPPLRPGPRPVEGQREDDRTEDREGPHAQLQELVDVEITGQDLGVGPAGAGRALRWPSVQGHVRGPARRRRACGFLHCAQAKGTAETGPQQDPPDTPGRAAGCRHSERGAQG